MRLLDGSLIILVQQTGSGPIFIGSADGGKTWSKPYHGILPDGVGVSTLGVGHDGRLITVLEQASENLGTSAVKKHTVGLPDGRECLTYKGYRYSGTLRLAYSSNQGETWTMGNSVDFSPMVAAWAWVGGRILELSDGTLVIPVAGYLSDQDMDGIWLSTGVVLSEDDGTTWDLSVIGRGSSSDWVIFSEPAVAKLEGDMLVVLMRTEDRVTKRNSTDSQGNRHGLHQARSNDGGKTWSSPVKTLKGTHCSLIQLLDGVLLCGCHRPPRLALSADGGENWYANMLWSTEDPSGNWGWYTSVEMVDETTAVAVIKQYPAKNIVSICHLHCQPEKAIYSDQGKTWEMDCEIDHSPMNSAWVWTGGRMLELDDGTLVVPVAGYLQTGWLSSGVLLSSDDGANWSFSIIGCGNPSNMMIFSEPAIAN